MRGNAHLTPGCARRVNRNPNRGAKVLEPDVQYVDEKLGQFMGAVGHLPRHRLAGDGQVENQRIEVTAGAGKAAPLLEANPKILPELAEIVGRTMTVEKAKRYDSMEELRTALASVASNL